MFTSGLNRQGFSASPPVRSMAQWQATPTFGRRKQEKPEGLSDDAFELLNATPKGKSHAKPATGEGGLRNQLGWGKRDLIHFINAKDELIDRGLVHEIWKTVKTPYRINGLFPKEERQQGLGQKTMDADVPHLYQDGWRERRAARKQAGKKQWFPWFVFPKLNV